MLTAILLVSNISMKLPNHFVTNLFHMKNVILFICFLFFAGCYNGNQDQQFNEPIPSGMDYDEGPSKPPAPPQSDPSNQGEPNEEVVDKGKKIIRDGHIKMEVGQLAEAKLFIDTTLKAFGAYYENETFESNSYESLYRLKIRVPASNFDNLVNAANEQGGKILLKNINARDVTEEFYDLTTRLENNESYLAQYRKLLGRATTINDILEIQEKIRVIEEEMDSKKGRLKFLSDQVGYSTLNLTLIEKHEWREGNKKNFWQKILASLESGSEIFAEFVLVVLGLWPFVILVGLLVYFVKRRRTAKRKREN